MRAYVSTSYDTFLKDVRCGFCGLEYSFESLGETSCVSSHEITFDSRSMKADAYGNAKSRAETSLQRGAVFCPKCGMYPQAAANSNRMTFAILCGLLCFVLACVLWAVAFVGLEVDIVLTWLLVLASSVSATWAVFLGILFRPNALNMASARSYPQLKSGNVIPLSLPNLDCDDEDLRQMDRSIQTENYYEMLLKIFGYCGSISLAFFIVFLITPAGDHSTLKLLGLTIFAIMSTVIAVFILYMACRPAAKSSKPLDRSTH